MPIRKLYAANFYINECSGERIERYIKDFQLPEEPSKATAGIVPHAGWSYSGSVAAKVFKCIKEKSKVTTFILFGANHRWEVAWNSIYIDGAWLTPFGEIEIDYETAALISKNLGNFLIEDTEAHSEEHSLEVQMPFIKYFFPKAKVVPIIIVPDADSSIVGQEIGKLASQSEKEIVIVGTTDLTHYGNNYGFTPKGYGSEALKWLKENDDRIINLALKMKGEEIVNEALKNHNACGSGAMAAAVSAAKAIGAEKGYLIEYKTSHDVEKRGEFYMGVGYAGIVF